MPGILGYTLLMSSVAGITIHDGSTRMRTILGGGTNCGCQFWSARTNLGMCCVCVK